MLFEDDVTDAVCTELRQRGYDIQVCARTTDRGPDIVAIKHGADGFTLFVESKGQGSSKKGTPGYAKEFPTRQVRVHVPEALYAACAVLAGAHGDRPRRAGIALPDTRRHRERVDRIRPVLKQLGIVVFWVAQDRTVQVEADWTL